MKCNGFSLKESKRTSFAQNIFVQERLSDFVCRDHSIFFQQPVNQFSSKVVQNQIKHHRVVASGHIRLPQYSGIQFRTGHISHESMQCGKRIASNWSQVHPTSTTTFAAFDVLLCGLALFEDWGRTCILLEPPIVWLQVRLSSVCTWSSLARADTTFEQLPQKRLAL